MLRGDDRYPTSPPLSGVGAHTDWSVNSDELLSSPFPPTRRSRRSGARGNRGGDAPSATGARDRGRSVADSAVAGCGLRTTRGPGVRSRRRRAGRRSLSHRSGRRCDSRGRESPCSRRPARFVRLPFRRLARHDSFGAAGVGGASRLRATSRASLPRRRHGDRPSSGVGVGSDLRLGCSGLGARPHSERSRGDAG